MDVSLSCFPELPETALALANNKKKLLVFLFCFYLSSLPPGPSSTPLRSITGGTGPHESTSSRD